MGSLRPSLLHKPTTFDKVETRPLSELTNRMSEGNKGKEVRSKHSTRNQTAVNNSKNSLSKDKISKNNNILIKEIIVFRLYYKTLQKFKETHEVPESLKSILGNETIRRVTLLKKLVCSRDLSTNVPFCLDDGESYLNPLQNP